MSSLAFGAVRLFATPCFRSQALLLRDVKFVINSPVRSHLFATNVNNGFKTLSTGAKPNIISSSLRQCGLMRSWTTVNNNAATSSRWITASARQGLRGLQQLRRLNLPRSEGNEWSELQKLSIGQRLKVMVKKYWYIAVPLHIAGSLAWFGSLFLLCKFAIDGTKIIAWVKPYVMNIQSMPETVKKMFEKDPDSLGNLAVAALLYKLATPARYMTTIFGTFYVVKFLLRKGILVKSAKEISSTAKTFSSHAIAKNLAKRKARKTGGGGVGHHSPKPKP